LDSPRIALIRRLFDHIERNDLQASLEELLANSTEDVVFEPHSAYGQELRGAEALRQFWARFAEEGRQVRAGLYSIAEEGDTVIASGWVRTIDEGRLADTQVRWIYRFNAEGKIVSAGVERS
jgi:ketosteroid isomerase-like protein